MEPSPFYSFEQAALEMDHRGERGIPFVFFVDYSLEKAWVGSEEEGIALGFHLAFNAKGAKGSDIELQKFPLSLEAYTLKFNHVQAGLYRGDSFLTNLTAETPIQTDLTLSDIYLSLIHI
jgi:para-aminobenzoate synthetase component 1